MKTKTNSEFIEEAKQVHGSKYDYSKTKYINARTKVCVICPEHGEFWQMPDAHLRGQGCKKCASEKTANIQRKNTYKFIEEAKNVHGDKYDYSKVNITGNNKSKVCIICPEHGEFWQAPVNHISLGQGCPACSRIESSRKLANTTKDFIEKAKQVHGDKYDYSKTEYVNWKTKVCIICPKHGEFWQNPLSHINGNSCPICSKEQKNLSTDEFINKAKKIHGDKYDYSKVEYVDTYTEVEILCKKHGSFLQKPFNHLQGCGCQKCGVRVSKMESEILSFLKEHLNCEIKEHNRTILNGNELDLYIPSKNIAIEINGIRWHSEEFSKNRNYHLQKTNKCAENGISLIHIFEDEYILHKEIVLSKLKRIIGFENNLNKIYARKTKVFTIPKKEGNNFLEKNHIQGKCNSSLYLGCFYEDNLIGVMSFTKLNKSTWELTRFSTDNNYICCGVGGKLLSFFKKNNDWERIISFADRRWTINSNDNLYTKLGFSLVKTLKPDYRYVVGLNRIHKFNFRKQILHKKYGLPLTMTEHEMTKKLGFYRIWDCGLFKYELKKKK